MNQSTYSQQQANRWVERGEYPLDIAFYYQLPIPVVALQGFKEWLTKGVRNSSRRQVLSQLNIEDLRQLAKKNKWYLGRIHVKVANNSIFYVPGQDGTAERRAIREDILKEKGII